MNLGTIRALSLAVPWVTMACGNSQPVAQAPAPAAPVDAAAPVVDAPVERPFAKTVLEAQTLIQEQIDTRMKALWKCVDPFRKSKGDPHMSVVIDVGIDQEGNLLGVTMPSAKGGEFDPTLKQCLWDNLHGLAFPRSHAGVITVRQTFSDASVTP